MSLLPCSSKSAGEQKLAESYPPSPPCSCPVCRSYCLRPGWWTVDEARRALGAGLGKRMMLELAPEGDFAVLSPAFRGNEGQIALQEYARRGCTFLQRQRCELHGSIYQPLECRFCHHSRSGEGLQCHSDLEKDWHTGKGKVLVDFWIATVLRKVH